MNTLLRWLLAALVGLACRWLAVKVGGTCPLDAGSFVCSHWETVAGIAAAILTALGYPVKRPKFAASKAPQRAETVTRTTVPGAPEVSTTAPEGVEFTVEVRTQAELEREQQKFGDGGG